MRPPGAPIPDTPPLTPSDLATGARNFRLKMAVLTLRAERALNATRDRYGRTVLPEAAATARALRAREAIAEYRSHLAPHAEELLGAAHLAIDERTPARHASGWRSVLYDLASSASTIRHALDHPAAPGSATEREQHQDLWPHLAAWADHGYIAADLAEQHRRPGVPLTGDELLDWTDRAQAAQRRDELELIESWYAADGKPITLAYLHEDDDSTVVALSGDPDAPGWHVLGHYADEYAAGQALPPPVPPGVFKPDASRFNRPEQAPETTLQELLRDIHEARSAGDVSETLLTVAQHGYEAGPMVRLHELLRTAGKFAAALETVQGRQIGGRLTALSRQLDFLTQEVHEAAEELGETVAVLPPYRIPHTRSREQPAVNTTPAVPPPRTSTPARHR
ncbi:hypothetical protein ACIO3O_08385 [Streptomyces sp. NPDC087440]|uniref:hypothetical protein n=1 Tax=Streptomyces sp. NPDC087440 TaxID=3365790 RepID=UPI00381D6C7B